MKEAELRLVSELMKNSRRSDRELAKVLGVSQPTVSRMIKKLEKEGAIKEYTMMPDFTKLGYELMALTFVSIKPTLGREEADKGRAMAQEQVKESPGNIIMLERGIGLGHTGVMISFHQDYSGYSQFIHSFKQASTTQAYVSENVESFLIDQRQNTLPSPNTISPSG